MGPVEPTNSRQIYFCYICNGPGTTRHHLIPKTFLPRRFLNGNDMLRLCADCHRDVHFYFSIYDLAVHFNTPEKLKAELASRKLQLTPAVERLMGERKIISRNAAKKTIRNKPFPPSDFIGSR